MSQRIDQVVADRLRTSVRRLGNQGAVDNARRSAEAERRALEELEELAHRVTPPPVG